MNQVTVNAELRARLQGLDEPLDFCDEHGRLLGRFVPCTAEPSSPGLEPGIPAAELQRRSDCFHGRPLSELLSQWEQPR